VAAEGPVRVKADSRTAAKHRRYSITSSATASTLGGTAMPIALAVMRLMAKTNLVGCSTGIFINVVARSTE
jgi:hypothetical protein